MRTLILRTALVAALGTFTFSAMAIAGQPAPEPVAKKKKAKTQTGIKWSVSPSTVQIFVDGKKVGEAGKLDVTKTKPGRHAVRLVNGEDETEFDVMVKKGQVLQLTYEFTDA